ncbi:MAG: hypothetical protein RRA45_09605 [Saccharolobus sp.]|jgi:predicted peroxiredoxin|uniref:hypothetical protein n=1 Tax=Saccharolobus sp. TaxID=2100761 RepID=UPI0028CD0714|nr:hypothetical protein [Saccharolobus sp.]MDT7862455.1 hypothetical protein [Saccharolobus sp.]
MSLVIVKFEDDHTFYTISDNGLISKTNPDKFDILVVKKIDKDKVYNAIKEGYKIFECNESKEECLIKVLNKIFPYCKTCKFS